MNVAIWILALLTTGLQAGTYYAWATGVMPGLARVDDKTFVATMWSVNHRRTHGLRARWVQLNAVRAFTSTLSLVTLGMAAVV